MAMVYTAKAAVEISGFHAFEDGSGLLRKRRRTMSVSPRGGLQ